MKRIVIPSLIAAATMLAAACSGASTGASDVGTETSAASVEQSAAASSESSEPSSEAGGSSATEQGAATTGCDGQPADVCDAWEKVQFRPVPDWLTLSPAESLEPAGTLAGYSDGEGPRPQWYNSLTITPEQVAQIRDKKLTAAILNWDSAVYNVAIANGAKHVFEALGIKVIAETDWGFDPGKLSRQLSSVLLQKPDIILTGGTLTPENAPQILAPAVKQGVTIALMSAGVKPDLWTPGKEFVNFTSYPTYELGRTIADSIHKAYPDGANVGMVYWKTDTPIVIQRDQGFIDQLGKYPNLKLVDRSGFSDPGQAGSVASAMLLKQKDLDVIYAPWDSPPGDAIVAAIKASGRTNVKMVSLDIGITGAQGIRDGSTVLEESGEDVYDWGTTAALSAAMHLIGAQVPEFLVTPVFSCTKDNLESCWDFMHGPGIPLPQ